MKLFPCWAPFPPILPMAANDVTNCCFDWLILLLTLPLLISTVYQAIQSSHPLFRALLFFNVEMPSFFFTLFMIADLTACGSNFSFNHYLVPWYSVCGLDHSISKTWNPTRNVEFHTDLLNQNLHFCKTPVWFSSIWSLRSTVLVSEVTLPLYLQFFISTRQK